MGRSKAAENTAPIKDFHLINRREFFAVYVGKNAEKESEVTLYDGNGKARIKMSVSADGNPKLDFLDAAGKAIYSLQIRPENN